MDGGAWKTTVHGVARVGHDLVTKPPPWGEEGQDDSPHRGRGQGAWGISFRASTHVPHHELDRGEQGGKVLKSPSLFGGRWESSVTKAYNKWLWGHKAIVMPVQ